jgi:hypothetical protein
MIIKQNALSVEADYISGEPEQGFIYAAGSAVVNSLKTNIKI